MSAGYGGRRISYGQAVAMDQMLRQAREMTERAVAGAQQVGDHAVQKARHMARQIMRSDPDEWRPGPPRPPVVSEALDYHHELAKVLTAARMDQTPNHQELAAYLRAKSYTLKYTEMRHVGLRHREVTLNHLWDVWSNEPDTPQDERVFIQPDPYRPWIEYESVRPGERASFSLAHYIRAATERAGLEFLWADQDHAQWVASHYRREQPPRPRAVFAWLYVPPSSGVRRRTQLLVYPVGTGPKEYELQRIAGFEVACLLGLYHLMPWLFSGPGHPGDLKVLPNPRGDTGITPLLHVYARQLLHTEGPWWLQCGTGSGCIGCSCPATEALLNTRPIYHSEATGQFDNHPDPPSWMADAGATAQPSRPSQPELRGGEQVALQMTPLHRETPRPLYPASFDDRAREVPIVQAADHPSDELQPSFAGKKIRQLRRTLGEFTQDDDDEHAEPAHEQELPPLMEWDGEVESLLDTDCRQWMASSAPTNLLTPMADMADIDTVKVVDDQAEDPTPDGLDETRHLRHRRKR